MTMRGKQAMARPTGHSGAAAASPALQSTAAGRFARAFADGLAIDRASFLLGRDAGERGDPRRLPPGLDALSFFLGYDAGRGRTREGSA